MLTNGTRQYVKNNGFTATANINVTGVVSIWTCEDDEITNRMHTFLTPDAAIEFATQILAAAQELKQAGY